MISLCDGATGGKQKHVGGVDIARARATFLYAAQSQSIFNVLLFENDYYYPHLCGAKVAANC